MRRFVDTRNLKLSKLRATKYRSYEDEDGEILLFTVTTLTLGLRGQTVPLEHLVESLDGSYDGISDDEEVRVEVDEWCEGVGDSGVAGDRGTPDRTASETPW